MRAFQSIPVAPRAWQRSCFGPSGERSHGRKQAESRQDVKDPPRQSVEDGDAVAGDPSTCLEVAWRRKAAPIEGAVRHLVAAKGASLPRVSMHREAKVCLTFTSPNRPQISGQVPAIDSAWKVSGLDVTHKTTSPTLITVRASTSLDIVILEFWTSAHSYTHTRRSLATSGWRIQFPGSADQPSQNAKMSDRFPHVFRVEVVVGSKREARSFKGAGRPSFQTESETRRKDALFKETGTRTVT